MDIGMYTDGTCSVRGGGGHTQFLHVLSELQKFPTTYFDKQKKTKNRILPKFRLIFAQIFYINSWQFFRFFEIEIQMHKLRKLNTRVWK